MVIPCTKTEKATTAKLMVMIWSRRGISGGSPRARASARAPAQSSPKQHVLMAELDPPAGQREEQAAGIYRRRPAQRHEQKGRHHRTGQQIDVRTMHADQQKHQRIGEGGIFPERLDGFSAARAQPRPANGN